MKCRDLQKVKKVKCKKIEEFQSDADEDDEIVEEEIEEEESNKEENTDGNKGEAIHFEEGRAKHRIPSKGTLFENALQTKKIVSKWFACIYDSKQSSNFYIGRAHIKDS